MQIVHIAHIDDILGGVNIAVPQHVISQQEFQDVALLNVTNKKIDGVSHQLEYKAPFEGFPEPFHKPDLVVFHEVYRPVYLKIYKYLIKNRIPYIIIPHGGLTVYAQRIKALKKCVANKLLFEAFFNQAEAIQCLSENEKKNLAFQLPAFVSGNGITIKQAKEVFSRDGLRIVFVGRLDIGIKGLDLLMGAVEMEAAFLRANRVRIELYGPADTNAKETLLTLINTKNIDDLVQISGPVIEEKKISTLLSADCFIQVSRSEGMSMGILEALGMGLPCILTEGTGMTEMLKRYDAGWGAKTSASGIAGALHRAVEEKEQIFQKSQNARRLVQENFLWRNIAEQTLKQYRALAEK